MHLQSALLSHRHRKSCSYSRTGVHRDSGPIEGSIGVFTDLWIGKMEVCYPP